jgi:hypothetical protein
MISWASTDASVQPPGNVVGVVGGTVGLVVVVATEVVEVEEVVAGDVEEVEEAAGCVVGVVLPAAPHEARRTTAAPTGIQT